MKNLFTTLAAFLILHSSFSIAVAATLPIQTGQTTCYRPEGNTYACAGTGQDGELQPGVAWPDPRFTDNSDGTITDNLTGLIWAQNMRTPGPTDGFTGLNCTKSGVQVNWQEALDHVKCINTYSYLGFTDWRLPTAAELASIVDYGISDQQARFSSAGFTVGGYYYWSATTRTDNASYAFALDKTSGAITPKNNKGWNYDANLSTGYTIYAWPVRGNR